jgi:outer membrane protein OmpA-like peptidoglycan-associated protein
MSSAAVIPDLMGLVTRQFSPEVIRRAASALGEDHDRTARAVSASVPSVLTALSDVASSPSGASHLGDVIEENRRQVGDQPGGDGSVIGSTDGAVDRGIRLFDAELGDRSSKITEAVAGSSGIRRDSAHKLLGGVTAVALAAIGKNVAGPALGTALREQRGDWIRRLPGPLASIFGGAPAAVTAVPRHEHTYDRPVVGHTARPAPAAPSRSWVFPAVLAAIALLGFGLLRGRHHRTVSQVTPVTQVLPGSPVAVRLPNGQTLTVPSGSTTFALASFLGNPSATAPRRFTLSPMNFDFGTTNLTQQSMSTVNELAAVMRAYPSAQFRVESSTDNVGAPEANQALSVARSEAVRDLLVARGVNTANIQSVGLGQEHPIASNDTEAGRALNRRTDIVVTSR